MIINLADSKGDRVLVLETEHNDPDQSIEVDFIGDRDLIQRFYLEVDSGKYGHYGHIFHLNSTTNLDLQKVVYDLKGFKVLSVKPQIKAKKLPEGAIS